MMHENTSAGAYVRIGTGRRFHILRDEINTICGKRRLLGRDEPQTERPTGIDAMCWACERNASAHARRQKVGKA